MPAYPAPPEGVVTLTARLRVDEPDPPDRPVVRGDGAPQLYAADSRVVGATAGLESAGAAPAAGGPARGAGPGAGGPTVADAAPFTNFSYALQWLTFGLIALVALGYFVRLEMLQRRSGAAARTGRRCGTRWRATTSRPSGPDPAVAGRRP